MIFPYYFNNFNKNRGWRGGLLCFIGKLCKYVPGKLEHKLEAAVPVLCWYFFNLNKKTKVKKNYSFLIAKMHCINFCQQLLAGVCSKRKQFAKVFQISGVILATGQSIKSFSFIFEGFCLYFKSTFTIKTFMNNFCNEFSRTPHYGYIC